MEKNYDMEVLANFMLRMIEKYGNEVLNKIEKKQQNNDEKK